MPATTEESKTIRMQFDMPASKAEEMERLRETTGIKTNRDLISNALALFKWAVREAEQGRIIASVDELNNRYKEVILPALEQVATHAPVNLARRDREGSPPD